MTSIDLKYMHEYLFQVYRHSVHMIGQRTFKRYPFSYHIDHDHPIRRLTGPYTPVVQVKNQTLVKGWAILYKGKEGVKAGLISEVFTETGLIKDCKLIVIPAPGMFSFIRSGRVRGRKGRVMVEQKQIVFNPANTFKPGMTEKDYPLTERVRYISGPDRIDYIMGVYYRRPFILDKHVIRNHIFNEDEKHLISPYYLDLLPLAKRSAPIRVKIPRKQKKALKRQIYASGPGQVLFKYNHDSIKVYLHPGVDHEKVCFPSRGPRVESFTPTLSKASFEQAKAKQVSLLKILNT